MAADVSIAARRGDKLGHAALGPLARRQVRFLVDAEKQGDALRRRVADVGPGGAGLDLGQGILVEQGVEAARTLFGEKASGARTRTGLSPPSSALATW